MNTAHVLDLDPRFFELPYNPLFRYRDLIDANATTEASNLLRNLDNFLYETLLIVR